MLKFDFSIQTRNRLKIASIVIAGRDREDAEKKLKQMYRNCEILSCQVNQGQTTALRIGPFAPRMALGLK